MLGDPSHSAPIKGKGTKEILGSSMFMGVAHWRWISLLGGMVESFSWTSPKVSNIDLILLLTLLPAVPGVSQGRDTLFCFSREFASSPLLTWGLTYLKYSFNSPSFFESCTFTFQIQLLGITNSWEYKEFWGCKSYFLHHSHWQFRI